MGVIADNVDFVSDAKSAARNALDVDTGSFRPVSDDLNIPPAVIVAGVVIAAGALIFGRKIK